MEVQSEGEAEDLPYSRDLLRRFACTTCNEKPPKQLLEAASMASPDAVEMDLTLGLSLGGCFTNDPKETRLVRSSSTAALTMAPKEKEILPSAAPIARTCSLPLDEEDENRKRKEMQSLKRMEAKMKRSVKRNSLRSAPAMAAAEVAARRHRREEVGVLGDADIRRGFSPKSVNITSAAPKHATMGLSRAPGLRRSTSEFDLRAVKAPEDAYDQRTMSTSSAGVPSLNEADSSHKASSANIRAAAQMPTAMIRSPMSLGEDEEEEAAKRIEGYGWRSMMEDEMMPCVSTKVEGPDGKRVEGFLYKYRKGEEVRILCVCHGSFLSPAEFIKHAGGGDVDNPLRHILVKPKLIN